MRLLSSCLAFALLTACGSATTESSESPAVAEHGGDEAEAEPGGDQAEAEPAAEASEPTSPMARAIVQAHDVRRAEHCAGPIAWSDELAGAAQAWAEQIASDGCTLRHSESPYGENLAAGSTGTLSPEQVVEMWYGESAHYRYRRGGFSMETGHFTQVVWAASARVGCATSTCNGLDVFVCNYDPPGNVSGEFDANVSPTSCR